MVRNISKGTTQIVKIHIGDKGGKGKEEPPKKKRQYKRKPKKPIMPLGTGNMPFTGMPLLGNPPLMPMPPISRMGWTVEPLQIKRAEEPPIHRIEHNQMNIINQPPRQIRDYVAQMLEQQQNAPRIEEMPEEPKSMRIEEPPAPIEEPQQPLVSALPSAEKKKRKPPVAKQEEPQYAQISLIDEEELPTAMKTGDELRALRDSGVITAEYLNQYNIKKVKEGQMSLFQLASKLGIPVPQAVRNSKTATIKYIIDHL